MTTKQVQKFGQERRKKSREQDTYYKVVVTLNSLAWLSLLICLILFHFARPEMVSGVQQFWGIEGRTSWSAEYIDALVMLLQAYCASGWVS